MKELRGKVAVVTGAASGIGRSMATRFAAEGMKLVLADIEREPLEATESAIRRTGASVVAVLTDVSSEQSVRSLAARVTEAFGAVHILCNNAGVGSPPGPIWEGSIADWKWILGVNLWGVIHGIHVFVPLMLAQTGECHIVNTASINGLVPVPLLGIYSASKAAVIAISESLHAELAMSGGQVRVSVLCPKVVRTRIRDWGRNRPVELSEPDRTPSTENGAGLSSFGLAPATVADETIRAIQEERFFVLFDDGDRALVHSHTEARVSKKNVKLTESRLERLARLGHAYSTIGSKTTQKGDK